jgi:biopolymer transport protein ExbD/biopolymer transport protein TolR
MAMGVNTGGKQRTATPVVNVTPLVDVALVVLIIFMMVTPMITKTFWLNLPQEEKTDAKPPPPDDKDPPLVMTVDRKGVVRINQTVLSKQDIKDRLPRMLASKKQQVLYFDAHDDVPYGIAMEVMDLARAGGARSIAILTQKVAQ